MYDTKEWRNSLLHLINNNVGFRWERKKIDGYLYCMHAKDLFNQIEDTIVTNNELAEGHLSCHINMLQDICLSESHFQSFLSIYIHI